jgi:hypothetical protein
VKAFLSFLDTYEELITNGLDLLSFFAAATEVSRIAGVAVGILPKIVAGSIIILTMALVALFWWRVFGTLWSTNSAKFCCSFSGFLLMQKLAFFEEIFKQVVMFGFLALWAVLFGLAAYAGEWLSRHLFLVGAVLFTTARVTALGVAFYKLAH